MTALGDVTRMQVSLQAAGRYYGEPDGLLGPLTFAGLLSHAAGRNLGALGILLGRAMAGNFRTFEISTRARICHWIAQGCHETGGFRHFVELGSGDGPDADPWDDYLERYDFRADLGNGAGGDGMLYRGRGIVQLTGKANYRTFGKRIGVDLVAHPERAAEPELAVLLFCLYWADRKINVLADKGVAGITPVTRAINGGVNGLADRTDIFNRLWKVWP